ncbi:MULTISPECIES: fructosamine kinase family protein [Thalassospira]|uniref:Fructosamine kinase n=2 Tax=Thalassospira TaxID=168934 RepID=A0A367WES2_9PROT|nr:MULTISPECIES: fructosamine kinase family protein [Thalassospira]MDG4718994.1 fructosamine kinase family protein [Thalassospira sp. FZY0004]RCK39954.1 fructosamine kinase [Thalassospira profundimaris]
MHNSALKDLIENLTSDVVASISNLSGGTMASVTRVELGSGRLLVIKQSHLANSDLKIEARMLRYFARHSPIHCPSVLHADNACLVMDYMANDNQMSQRVQRDLAEQLAAQHRITATTFGLEFDTLIGGLPQPNPQTESWVTFFGEHRLRHIAQAAHQGGQLSASTTARIDRLIDKLDGLIPDKPTAALLHGDLWGGNILCQDGKLAGLIDPALYYGDREIELAFGTLFGDLGPAFFGRYNEILPIEPGFFEERRDLYNLYPLLVHVRLFGAPYIGAVENILMRFGC